MEDIKEEGKEGHIENIYKKRKNTGEENKDI